jgi:crotonobetainyl-CoA:carnitine CoA-transferase CaiB-like acyl-CoA transferase
MYAMGEPDMPPLLILFGIMDQVTSITISQAIVTALLMRERFGIGQKIDTSLLGSSLYLQYINVLNALWLKQHPTRHDRSCTDPLRNHYLCQDGKWLAISNPGHWENRWPLFCHIFGLPQLGKDPNFDTKEKRYLHSKELIPVLDRVFFTKPRDEWIEVFNQHDIISCAVNTSLDLDSDPQVTENDYIVDFDSPISGKVRIPGFPIHFSQAEVRTKSLAPTLGEHTEQVLKDLGGYSEEEIKQFKQNRVT